MDFWVSSNIIPGVGAILGKTRLLDLLDRIQSKPTVTDHTGQVKT